MITSVLSSLLFGFIIGFKHAFEADHIAALTTIISRRKALGSIIADGIYWGIGHTMMLFLAGTIIILLKLSLSQIFQSAIELIVGIIVALLAVYSIIKISKDKFSKDKFHIHYHTHGKKLHAHFHSHSSSRIHKQLSRIHKQLSHIHKHHKKPLFVGLLHGLAGSGALVIMILSSLKSVYLGAVYAILFGIGSIFGMALIALALGATFVVQKRISWLDKSLRISANILAFIIGISIIHSGFASLYILTIYL